MNVMQTSKDLGMHTLDSNLMELVASGVISKEAALAFLGEKVE